MLIEPATLNLTCLRISNGASAIKGLPKRIKVLNWGENKTKKGVVRVGQQTISRLPQMQDHYGYDRIALDYEHNTVPGTPEYERTKEPREVAAYGVPLVIPGEGLFMDDLVYTPSGEKNALSYIDLSAAIKQDDDGEVVFFHSTALARQGAAEDVSFYSITITPQKKETTMDPEKLTTLNASVETIKGDLGKVLALSQTVQTQDATIKTISARLDKFERQALIDKATFAGKVIPLKADQLATIDLTTLSAMIDNLEVTVPLHRRTPSTSVEKPTDASAQALRDRAAKVDARAAELQATGAASSLIRAYSMADQEIPQVAVK